MADIKLKPCPFCGGHNLGYTRLYTPLPDFEDKGAQWLVQCRECQINFIFINRCEEKELRKIWNRRADNEHTD